MKPPIIDRPVVVHLRRHKIVYAALTAAFWAFWFYLWLPLLALLAWWLGFEQAYKYMVVLGGYQDFLKLLGVYAAIIATLGGALIAWAAYNIVRFRGVERRSPPAPVAVEEIAGIFAVDGAEVERWQGARRLVVTHDEHGHIARVDTPIQAVPAQG